MEFPDAGKQCANPNCNQLDFLPLKCVCNLCFCREHFAEHMIHCGDMSKNIETVTVYSQEKLFPCAKEGCSKKCLIPIVCDKCKQHFCIEHRHTAGSKVDDEKFLQKLIEIIKLPQEKFKNAKEAVDKQVEMNILKAQKKGKNIATANKIQLMKIKERAGGMRQIPIEERLYFRIFNKKYCPNGKEVFVSLTHPVGKAIDDIANYCKIPNRNNDLTAPKLRLFKKSNNQIITDNMSEKMATLINSSVIINGDLLNLEYVAQ